MTRIPGHLRARRGLAVIESVLVLPLLLLITFGTIEYGWVMLSDQNLTNVCQEAGRLAATPTATNATVNAQISTMMSSAGLGSAGYTTTYSPSNVASVATGGSLTVTITATYQAIMGGSIVPTPSQISSTVTMVKEGD